MFCTNQHLCIFTTNLFACVFSNDELFLVLRTQFPGKLRKTLFTPKGIKQTMYFQICCMNLGSTQNPEPLWHFVALVAQKFVNLIRCMKTTRGFVQVAPEAMREELSLKDLQEAAVAGFKPAATDEDAMTSVQTEESAKLEILGDINLVSEEQKESLMQLKEPQKYSTMKLKMVTG
jgi:hypothetical protein